MDRRRILAAHLLTLLLAAGCAAGRPQVPGRAPFTFARDTFAFPNETVWEYDVDTENGTIAWRKREPPPVFALRCGTVARVARQFWANARFDASLPRADESTYATLAEQIVSSEKRRPAGEQVVVPGYADLRSFSAEHPTLLQDAMAGPWQSYMQRGNWRMIFPFAPAHQERQAAALVDSLAHGWPPVVHLLRYPTRVINHMLLVYAAEETAAEIRFTAYDPNSADRPVTLTYERAARMFHLVATDYFPGGPVRAYEVYDGWMR